MPAAQRGNQALPQAEHGQSADASSHPKIQYKRLTTELADSLSSLARPLSPGSVCPPDTIEQTGAVRDNIPCISCVGLIGRHSDEFPALPRRETFAKEMGDHFEKLSPRAALIATLPCMQQLASVPNSAAAFTRFFAQADVDRLSHSKHAAAKVHSLNSDIRNELTEREFEVLECVALLHDLGHRLGSHALDRIFAAHPGAPEIHKFGWGTEFHEFHTAVIIARDKKLKEALGDIHGDVLSVLTLCDTRPRTAERTEGDKLPSFTEHFGVFSSTIPPERLKLLLHLVEDVLDRNSCLELDLTRGGFAGGYVKQAADLVRRFESALVVFNNELHVRVNTGDLPEGTAGWISEVELHDYISYRQLFREVVAASPASCNVDVFLREAISEGLRREAESRPRPWSDHESYEFLRRAFLQGRYEEVLDEAVLNVLQKAPHDPTQKAIDDLMAPLVTMTKSDFHTNHLDKLSPHQKKDGELGGDRDKAAEKSFEVCGVRRTDMTVFEYELRQYLMKFGYGSPFKGTQPTGHKVDISVIVTTDIEKHLRYKTLEPSGRTSIMDVCAIRSSPESVKVVVAARAVDSKGSPVPLAELQRLVQQFCREREEGTKPKTSATRYLKHGCLNHYDRHFFSRAFIPQEIISKIRAEMAEKARRAVEDGEQTLHVSTFQVGLEMMTSATQLFSKEVQERMKKAPGLWWERENKHGLRASDVQ